MNKSTISVFLKQSSTDVAAGITNNNWPVLNSAKFRGNEQILQLSIKTAVQMIRSQFRGLQKTNWPSLPFSINNLNTEYATISFTNV